MGPHRLEGLFNPRSVAVVGASEEPGSVAARVFARVDPALRCRLLARDGALIARGFADDAIAAAAFYVFFTGERPAWEYGGLAVGVILALTALSGFCPLYRLVGFRTCKASRLS